MAKKQKTTDTQNLESILFNCREYLRSNASLNDKRDLLLTLIFLRFIGEKFENTQSDMRQECINNGIKDEEVVNSFLNNPRHYKGIAFVPEKARWSMIINEPASKLNATLDDAIQELENSGDALKGCVRLGLFTSINLEANVVKKVVDEVNKISHKTFGEEKDLIGRVYEYFLKSFAVNATKEEGEFYTPHDIVELIAAFIEPYDGTLYDPCCGSGGMFIQCAKYVEAKQGDIKMVNVYGQERDPATYRLAKMNLAMRGISHHLGEKNADSFSNDLHKSLTFDFIMANPPFNLKKWYDISLSKDSRWADYSIPPEGNANYAWILHMLSKLKAGKGVAGFLLANGALGDSDAVTIRQRLIENDKIEAIVVLPRELFYTTDISVTLWILNENKKGSPLSPILSNIMLDELDKELDRRGLRYVRYADDFSIYCKSQWQARKTGNEIFLFLKSKLHLPINRVKSGIRRPVNFSLLGYGFVPTYKKGEKGKYQLVVSGKGWKNLKLKLKAITRKTTPASFDERIHKLKEVQRGWLQYYRMASIQEKLKDVDGWVRNRLRCCIWKQWKKSERRRKNLIRLGVDLEHAYSHSRSRMGTWAVACSPILKTTITVERLQQRGYEPMFTYYQKIAPFLNEPLYT